MGIAVTSEKTLRDEVVAPAPCGGGLWAIVLAGGEGLRLRPLTRRICGDERPKQYVTLAGHESLLEQTLDRVALAIPPERTVVVTHQRHAGYVTSALAGRAAPWILAQPESRGTAAGVLLPAHWISWRDPEATVAVFPSDHFIPEGRAFMRHVWSDWGTPSRVFQSLRRAGITPPWLRRLAAPGPSSGVA
ncbi:sugar phosphate nucleotidyltransferase [Nocardioides sp.]|uniref:sugar phosphate nucleotidyltransferase n=1 Tax=Nocardioides sp. TaxID=35761 RepID=UPI002733D74B|nr:sugar phosphate nucleotidyltransferase [Nocardioides sp.]MDP3890192.1 sugar phosphate nucleotidyltransferase [Nocardioides sp.]